MGYDNFKVKMAKDQKLVLEEENREFWSLNEHICAFEADVRNLF